MLQLVSPFDLEFMQSDGNTWRCTAITLKLPNLDKPLDIPLASHPDDASKNSGASA